MVSSKNGHFQNKREGNVIISDYCGAFNATGISAIFTDVITLAEPLSHWCWYQRPAPDAGISKDAIEEMIARYKTLHHYGCCAIGVSYTNVLINAVDLPKDGSIKVPFKVAKDKASLFSLFQQTLAEHKSEHEHTKANTKTLAKAHVSSIVDDFISATATVDCSDELIQAMTGHSQQQLKLQSNDITPGQYTVLQGFTALIRLVSFKLNDDAQAIKHWFNTEQPELGTCPQHLCLKPDGLYSLLRKVSER